MSSKKIARAINAASGNRPLVILANLSGFDGSPESMRELQLEYGAEIGRAVVNFKGPIVFCVVSRYHGGAYVVFSGKLNESIEAAALEGSYASVIGGAPAAAVVFAGEVEARTRHDPRVQRSSRQIAAAEGAEKARLRAQLAETLQSRPLRKARRGRRRVRPGAQRLPRLADGVARPHHPAGAPAAVSHRGGGARHVAISAMRAMERRHPAVNAFLGDATGDNPLADASFIWTRRSVKSGSRPASKRRWHACTSPNAAATGCSAAGRRSVRWRPISVA